MSEEMLTMIIFIAGALVTLGGGLFAGFAWSIRRTDNQFSAIQEQFKSVRYEMHQGFADIRSEMHQGFADIRQEFDGKFDSAQGASRGEFASVREDLRQIRGELTEIKISVARLEGPRDRLIWPRGTTNY